MASDSQSKRDETAADPALLGRVVAGKYRIEKLLGGGAMGAVYRARHDALDKNVAVKVMHAAMAVDPNFVGRFHREAKAASRLDHPNSMRVIDFGEEPDGLLYIAMEYLEGRDLYRVIHDDWPIANSDIADIMMQALAAIAVAHEMGVIHRDLKPENLMIVRAKDDEERESYHVKVCDFGIAKITDSDEDGEKKTSRPEERKLTTQGLVVGTPEYMSPEQARGEKLDARSDIYSMGIILYQLLTGRVPFTADTALAVVLKHITEPPTPPSTHWAGVHKGLEVVTMKALAKDRNDRFQTARAMRNAVREAVDGRPLPASDPGLPTAVEQIGPASSLAHSASVPVVIEGGKASYAPKSQSDHLAAVVSAPTVANGIPSTTGKELAPTLEPDGPRKKKRTGLTAAIVAVLVIGGVGAAFGEKYRHPAQPHHAAEPLGLDEEHTKARPTPAQPSATPSATAVPISREPVATASAPRERNEPKRVDRKGKALPSNSNRPQNESPEPPEAASAAPAPAPSSTDSAAAAAAATGTPTHEAETPAPPPSATSAPAAPAFSAAECRATTGVPRGNGATASGDLVKGTANAAFTACAKKLTERPASDTATLALQFGDNGRLQNATCAQCAPSIKACIEQHAHAMSVNFRSGDVTGEPSYEVPVTITCP